ncbi:MULTISPECIES: hypothetical protein [Streptomyces]|uniref:Uncharacterized protein n=1 Tax=Streptomyces griseocarneus TaxID=51201 RepID=A0ABX7RVA8_9ACTN|nr:MULTISPECIES: hypothetical protein [Streptomyces]QSY51421.1 hypothetical protein J3S04_11440 [Streptomyces griseocarneus]
MSHLVTENYIASQTEMLMSEAAQRGYMEGGQSVDAALRASRETHASALSEWGGTDNLIRAHAEFGTEMGAYGDRSLMSFTTDLERAKYFANGGPVHMARIHPSEGIWQTLETSTENEVLIPHAIKVKPWTE